MVTTSKNMGWILFLEQHARLCFIHYSTVSASKTVRGENCVLMQLTIYN